MNDVREAVVALLQGTDPKSTPPVVMRGPSGSEPKAVDPRPWWLVEFIDARGNAASMVVQDDAWRDDGAFVRVGGHAVRSENVVAVYKTTQPTSPNVHVPPGMQPPPPEPEPPTEGKFERLERERAEIEEALRVARAREEATIEVTWGKQMSKAVARSKTRYGVIVAGPGGPVFYDAEQIANGEVEDALYDITHTEGLE
jgi:hypothetical protein